MKIAVAGAGHVGISNGMLLARIANVTFFDINADRIAQLQARKSPFNDTEIERAFSEDTIKFNATTDAQQAFAEARFIVICTPTNYDYQHNSFDTSSLESVISVAQNINPRATFVIRSTIPIGYVRRVRLQFPSIKIIFVPEFLREGNALFDCLHPTRIIVGDTGAKAMEFAKLLRKASKQKRCPIIAMGADEAESVKLFSNAYLAMRVAFFNELDSFAITKELDVGHIISGIGLDPRIGMHYNNPSFGYGGYCLPKDALQLLASFGSVPQSLIGAIVESNGRRKKFVADYIVGRKPNIVGVFRLAMKAGSDNFREASVIDVISHLQKQGVKVIIFEPSLNSPNFANCDVYDDLKIFKQHSSIILSNRNYDDLADVADKVFTRDLFGIG